MFLEHFKVTGSAVTQIFLLAGIGYLLVRRRFLAPEGLDAMSRLVMDITLPALIFSQLVQHFSFALYRNWWIFPLASLAVTAVGFAVGSLFSYFIKGQQHKLQFLNLVTFQNSGYLPLALTAALLNKEEASAMFIYIFLFLIGFNLVMFSVGAHMLSYQKERKFELESLLSMPVVATAFTLVFIFLGLKNYVPETVLKPLDMLGGCTLPLALLVVGGNLAELKLSHIDKRAIALLLAAKMVILPLLGLGFVIAFRLPQLIALLVLIQLAMPSAVTLSVIIRHYEKEDLLISQGIFFSHIASVISVPLFLILYFNLAVIK